MKAANIESWVQQCIVDPLQFNLSSKKWSSGQNFHVYEMFFCPSTHHMSLLKKRYRKFFIFFAFRVFKRNIRSLLLCSSTLSFIKFILEVLPCCGTTLCTVYWVSQDTVLLRARNVDFHSETAQGKCFVEFRNLFAMATQPTRHAFYTNWRRCRTDDSDLSRCSREPLDWLHQCQRQYLFARPNRSLVSDSQSS